ncbi:MAG: sigma-54-dependent Fis family transcriptional regulator [bacterium]|nr:sigma-54-dependent Fis family transcriptional regulator [bacterium]
MSKLSKSCSEECRTVKETLKRKYALKQILGKSRVVKDLHRKIEKISTCDVSVLITGESGTGKELVARAIHYLSRRAGKPFITVNCGAIPDNLFENELFGHLKGAFTDAGYQQQGLVKEAEAGTLFLDEIGIINPAIQVKLLRLLQDKGYKVLGDSKPHSADIRIVAATNEKLESLVKKGDFREDLYYRLNIVSLHLPPLRKRKEDIPILANYFIEKYCREYKKSFDSISSDALDILLAYDWPGNIRELENKMQQTIVMASGPIISHSDLQWSPIKNETVTVGSLKQESFSQAKKRIVTIFERNYLIKLLTEFNGDVVGAAARAGKSRTALWNLLSKHHLHPDQFKQNPQL